MIKKPIVANYIFFTVFTLNKVNCFGYINIVIVYHL